VEKIKKIYLRHELSPKQWVIVSVLILLISFVPLFFLQGGSEIVCQGAHNSADPYACMDAWGVWSLWIWGTMLGFSLLSSVLAFYGDNKRRHIFWKTLCFLIPGSALFIFLGYKTEFCLMWSCSDFGETNILISFFVSIAFVLALGWSIMLPWRFKKISLRASFWVMFAVVSSLLIGLVYLNEVIRMRDYDIAHSFSLNYNKEQAVQECKKALFSSSRDMCLATYAIHFHDQSICHSSSTDEKSNECIAGVNASCFSSYHKAWGSCSD
jgi:hypothetical protein